MGRTHGTVKKIGKQASVTSKRLRSSAGTNSNMAEAVSNVNKNEHSKKTEVSAKPVCKEVSKWPIPELDEAAITSTKRTRMSRPSDMGKAVSKRATSNSPRQLQNDDILDTDPHQPYNVSFANHDQLLEVEVYAPDNAFNSDNTQSSEESEQEISFRQTDESDVDPENRSSWRMLPARNRHKM